MKYKLLAAVVAASVMAAPAFAADSNAVNLSTDQAKLSYIFGLNMGSTMHAQNIAVDPAILMKGLNDGLNGTPPAMTPAQIKEVLQRFQKEMMAKQENMLKQQAAVNAKEGEAFMKANAAKPGVKTLGSDLQYRVITAGNGAKPTANDTVTVTYEGKLVNGTVFDSTAKTGGKPVSLPMAHMIPGMQQVMTMMPVGSTWEVVMGPKVAYGERGVPMSPIGPNETLIFTLTLKSIAPTKAA